MAWCCAEPVGWLGEEILLVVADPGQVADGSQQRRGHLQFLAVAQPPAEPGMAVAEVGADPGAVSLSIRDRRTSATSIRSATSWRAVWGPGSGASSPSCPPVPVSPSAATGRRWGGAVQQPTGASR
jgi:hypothetical protein